MPTATSLRIVISGVTRGLGRALTAGFIARGHTVVGCGRSADDIAKLTAAYPAPHQFSVCDVTDAAAVETWAQNVLATGPAPDLLLNNAALINENHQLWEVPVDEFSRLMDVNIKGVFHVLRAFLPSMIATSRGVVVNFSSTWGRSTSPEVAPYCASKFAIEGLTKALAQELPRGLSAVALNPGVIDTDMLRTCFAEGAGAYPNAEQWAKRAVPFLLKLSASDNGQSVNVP